MTDYLRQSADYHNPAVASALDELSFWSSRFGALLFEHLPIRGGINILDVGCGAGFPLFEMAHVFGSSCRLTGIDMWREGLQRARSKLAVHGLRNVSLVEADAARMPFAGSAFDLIVSNLGVNNWEDPQAVLAECSRVLRPGGRIALTTNVKGHMQEFYKVFGEVVQAHKRPDYLERLHANEEHRGSRDSVCASLEGAGFRIVKVVEGSFTMRYLDGSALLRHSLTRFGFLGGWRRVVDPEDEEAVFLATEDRLNALTGQTGELAMTIPTLYVEGEKR